MGHSRNTPEPWHKGWGAVQNLVFWVVLLVVLWVLVAVYGVPHPSG